MDIARSDIMKVSCHLQMATSGKVLMVLQQHQLKQCIVDVICASEQTDVSPLTLVGDQLGMWQYSGGPMEASV